MQENMGPLTDKELAEEEIDVAFAMLEMTKYKKAKVMLKKLYMLSLKHKLYMLPCDDCGGEVQIVPIECTQPDVFGIQCMKCVRHCKYDADHLEKLYKFNKEIIDKRKNNEPKCSFCEGEARAALIRDSNGGKLCLVCKDCGKHIN